MSPASQTPVVDNQRLLDELRKLQTSTRQVHEQIVSTLDDLTARVARLESSRR